MAQRLGDASLSFHLSAELPLTFGSEHIVSIISIHPPFQCDSYAAASCWMSILYRDIYAARRFRKQIFLSVDVPPSFLTMGQGSKLLLEVERGLVETLKEMEGA